LRRSVIAQRLTERHRVTIGHLRPFSSPERVPAGGVITRRP